MIRKLTPALLKAGTKFRDVSIKHTGDPVYVYTVVDSQEDLYGTRTTLKYSNPKQTHVIPQWEDYRFQVESGLLSSEDQVTMECYAKMCDDIPEGSILEFKAEAVPGSSEVTRFKVVANKVKTHSQAYARILTVAPFRGDVRR